MPYDMQYSCNSSSAHLSESHRQAEATMLLVMSNSLHRRQTGARLGMAIQAIGKTQADICRALSVSPSKLGNWLRGDYYPDPYFVARFCDRFSVTADWIYRGRVSSTMGVSLADTLWAAGEASALEDAGATSPAPEARRPGRPRKVAAKIFAG